MRDRDKGIIFRQDFFFLQTSIKRGTSTSLALTTAVLEVVSKRTIEIFRSIFGYISGGVT